MDWTNERYVRVYVRDTLEWLALSWHARGLACLLFRKVDRAGVIELGRIGLKGVAALVQAPWAEIEGPLQELLDDGCFEMRNGCLIAPNFIEAQEAKQSDAQRQRESRARRRDIARGIVTDCDGVTKCDSHAVTKRNSDVTKSDALSQPVTACHTESQPVTPSLAVPSLAVPSRAEEVARARDATAAPAQGSNERAPAGPICEGCDSAVIASPGELCPACTAAERQLPAPSDPDVAKIAERIRSHAIFARLNADHIAETHAHHCSTGGKRLSWVLAAIDECADAANAAAAAPGESWAEGYKADRISRYIRRAKAPKKREWADNPDGPSVPSDPRLRKRYVLPEVKNPVPASQIREFLKTAKLGDRVVAPDVSAQHQRAKAAAAGSEKT